MSDNKCSVSVLETEKSKCFGEIEKLALERLKMAILDTVKVLRENGVQIHVIHVKGKKNIVCDFLSRIDGSDIQRDIMELWNAQECKMYPIYTRQRRKADGISIEEFLEGQEDIFAGKRPKIALHDRKEIKKLPEEIAVPGSPRKDSVKDLHVGTCNHDKQSERFIRVIRNVGYEAINPFLLTLAYDAQCGAGLIYGYLYGEGSDNEVDHEVSLSDLVLGESDQVWLFSGHRLKAGRGQGMQRKKVGICPFCCKDAVLLKAATAPVVRNKSEVLSEKLREKMNKSNTQLAVLENLIMLAPYYASYKNKNSSKIEYYIDLYPSLWSSAGMNYLRYKKVDPLVKINLGLNCDLEDPESERLIENLDDFPMIEGERPKDADLFQPRMVDDEMNGNVQIPTDQATNDSSVKNSGEKFGNERPNISTYPPSRRRVVSTKRKLILFYHY